MSGQLSDTLTTISNQRNELNAVLKSMDEGVLAITQDRTLLHVNRVAGDILIPSTVKLRKVTLKHLYIIKDCSIALINCLNIKSSLRANLTE